MVLASGEAAKKLGGSLNGLQRRFGCERDCDSINRPTAIQRQQTQARRRGGLSYRTQEEDHAIKRRETAQPSPAMASQGKDDKKKGPSPSPLRSIIAGSTAGAVEIGMSPSPYCYSIRIANH